LKPKNVHLCRREGGGGGGEGGTKKLRESAWSSTKISKTVGAD
jgi:hypothetical protein